MEIAVPHCAIPREVERSLPVMFSAASSFVDAYDVAAAVKIAQEIQRRINDLLPAIILTKRNEYYIIRDTITGYRPKPFSPFAGTIFDTDVSK